MRTVETKQDNCFYKFYTTHDLTYCHHTLFYHHMLAFKHVKSSVDLSGSVVSLCL